MRTAFQKLERKEAKKTFAKRLNAVIDTLNITSVWLANLVGCSRQTIYDWKAGRKTPVSSDVWARLAFALNVSERWLRGEPVAMARTAADAVPAPFPVQKKPRPSADGLPTEYRTIHGHITAEHFEKIKAIARENNISLRAALARCLGAYFAMQKETAETTEERGGAVKIELDDMHKPLLKFMAEALKTTEEQLAKKMLQSELWRLSAPIRLDIKLQAQKEERKPKEPCAADRLP